jgi:preprotein translocase subunit SecE
MTKHRKNKPVLDQDGQPQTQGTAVQLTKPAPPTVIKLKPKKEKEAIKPPNKVQKFVHFLRDAKRELKMVTWPTRKETISSTGVLLALVAIAALYLFIIDSLVSLVVLDGLRNLLVKIVMQLRL